MFSTINLGEFADNESSRRENWNSTLIHSERKFSSSSSNDGSASAHARRHSLGHFNSIRNERFCTTSFIDEAPQSMAPKAPTDWRRTSRGEWISWDQDEFLFRSFAYLKCKTSSLFTSQASVETLEWIKFNWKQSNISFPYDLRSYSLTYIASHQRRIQKFG